MATLTPYLTIRDAAAAIEFYKRAFGAREEFRVAAPDGKRIMHAALVIGDSSLFLADEFTESPDCMPSPEKLGGSPVTGVAKSPDGDGLWVTRANGEVTGYGSVPALGTTPSSLAQPIVGIAPSLRQRAVSPQTPGLPRQSP